ncbi:MAG: hypothetical protein Q8O35_12725 [Humidesulfovibrio sp.]|jgi:hypothetical protein|nr:hypothetical protein [Humidesulfovibrio sp.]MDP2849035.1 hypothetical protein [Humidesulfovibrio sp.]
MAKSRMLVGDDERGVSLDIWGDGALLGHQMTRGARAQTAGFRAASTT